MLKVSEMSVLNEKKQPISTADVELGRNMIDAIRAMRGMAPLYAADTPTCYKSERYFSNTLGPGCRRVSSTGSSL